MEADVPHAPGRSRDQRRWNAHLDFSRLGSRWHCGSAVEVRRGRPRKTRCRALELTAIAMAVGSCRLSLAHLVYMARNATTVFQAISRSAAQDTTVTLAWTADREAKLFDQAEGLVAFKDRVEFWGWKEQRAWRVRLRRSRRSANWASGAARS
jgi:hypothetical protein